MATIPSRRLANPMLGIYFGIVAAALVAVAITALFLEALGLDDWIVRTLVTGGLVAVVVIIAGASFTNLPFELFAGGRRVPAVLTGLLVAASVVGGTGFVAIPGLMLLIGFDALFLTLGLTAGLVTLAILIAPFARKVGAYTLPGLLALRFEGRLVRAVAAGVVSVPLILVLVAELKIALLAAEWLSGHSQLSTAIPIALLVGLTLLAGGLRAAGWVGVALTFVLLAALLVPVTVIALLNGQLPVPQLTHGETMRLVHRMEMAQGISAAPADPLAFTLPGDGMHAIARRYATPFASIGPIAFHLAVLSVMIGVAGHPALLARTVATPGVYETRKSIGWAIAVVGLLFMTMSAAAVLLREILLTQLAGRPAGGAPAWVAAVEALGLATLDQGTARLALASLHIQRDGALPLLILASGLPAVLLYSLMAGVLAAALAAATGAIAALGTIIGEDVVHGPRSELVADRPRALAARAGWVAVTLVGIWLALALPADPLELFLWSLAVAGSTTFPALILAVWWKRATAPGIVTGLVAGLTVAAVALVGGELGGFGLPGPLAAVAGAPTAFATAMGVSLITPRPSRHALEMVRDLRVPSGEALYDRESRLAIARHRRQGPS